VLNEFAQGISLGARYGELGLKLGVNRLVVEDNSISVLVCLVKVPRLPRNSFSLDTVCLAEPEAIMAQVLNEALFYCCGAALVTWVVVAAASAWIS
jgi:hypothetical protein